MYKYEEQRKEVFTEHGQIMFLEIRDKIKSIIEYAGAATLGKAISGVTGDVWTMIACIDRLVEIGEICEVKRNDTENTTSRIFVFPVRKEK
jgi:hypothetical protein